MIYRLFYTKSAEEDLCRLQKATQKRIVKKVSEYMKLPNPLVKAKKLKSFVLDTYRFRVGDYRVIFRKDNEKNCIVVLVVLKIAHRKEAY